MRYLVIKETYEKTSDKESVCGLLQSSYQGREKTMVGINEPYNRAHEKGPGSGSGDIDKSAEKLVCSDERIDRTGIFGKSIIYP